MPDHARHLAHQMAGAYRFRRGIGYAAGALLAGILAGPAGLTATVIASRRPDRRLRPAGRPPGRRLPLRS